MKINFKIGMLAMIIIALVAFSISCAPPIGDEKVRVPAEVHPGLTDEMSCLDCHSELTPDITNDWKKSGHGKMNYGCYICHGDGTVSFTSKPTNDGCISCHSASTTHIEKYPHMSCFDCHNGHSLIVG